MRKLNITPERCIGCRTCELSCSFAHADKNKFGRSRINVFNFSETLNMPITCLQCEDAACVKACQYNALTRNEKTGAIELNEKKCVKCSACLGACPFGNVLLENNSGRFVKCDLCLGEPMCAKFCPSKTLEYK